jgi:hypothetical protein
MKGSLAPLLAVLAVLASLGLVFGTGVAGADKGAAQRVDIYGPNFDYFCDFSGIANGTETPTGSYAVLQYDKDANTVGATTQLRGLEPDTSYQVRLIQGVSDCFTIDGTITTNSQGNGTLNVSEPAVSTQAAVFVWRSDFTGSFYESAIFTHP